MALFTGEANMSYELSISTEPQCWIRDNFAQLTEFFERLDAFEKQSDDVYLLVHKDWDRQSMPDVVFRFNHSSEIIMEVNAVPEYIKEDLLCLFAAIKKHAELLIHDDNGEVPKIIGFLQSESE